MPILIPETIFIILGAYANLWLLQILSWPLTKKLLGNLPDEGWAVGRILGLLLTSLFVWETSYLGLPINTTLGILVGVMLVVLLGVFVLKKEGIRFLVPKKESFKLVVLEEYLFLVGFVGICLVRAFLPNLDSLEKFMDYGFIVRYMNSAALPAMDMWQAGNAINYYSFGHFWASVLIRFVGVAPEVGYNLVLGFIAGQSLSLSFLVCYLLGKNINHKGSMVGGFLGSILVVFGGNSHTIWYILKNRSIEGYWYADATRFIHNTIHEFPGYSLVVSDLHGHLFDLPVTLLFILIFYLFVEREKWWDKVLLGGLFAVMMMTNTWDVPIYGLLLCVWLVVKLTKNPEEFKSWLLKMVAVFGVTALLAIPWWLKFVPISSGIALVTQRSPLWQLCVLWGLAVVINVLAWIVSKKSESKLLIRTLIITSVLLVLIPEFIYAKDIYPDHPRANTMFKLTYQACILVGVIFGSMVGRVADEIKSKVTIGRSVLLVVCVAIFGSLLIFPTVSFPAFYENFNTFRGLNGETWLKEKAPEKYGVIQYLKQNKNDKNMVEAVGDSYTEFNAVSVYSGVPTIEGWRVHEWLWRGGYDSVSIREQQVKEIYEGKDVNKTKEILKLYKVDWVLVGPDEENMYLVNHPKIKSLGKVVWEMNESYLVKVN